MDDLPRENSPKPGAVSDVLAGVLVLIVEDQPLIALDTESMLVDIGASSVASFSIAEHALVWLQSGAPGVAVLDVNLGAPASFAVADELSLRGIPFAFTTGYGDDPEPLRARFRGAEALHARWLGRVLAICLTAAGKRP
jgi:CheY-like chemotaxis protein